MSEDTAEFIQNELASAGVNFYVHRNDISVPCPFICGLDRGDYKQKLQIHFTGEMIHCWVCKTSGNYNKLADIWGLKKIPLLVKNSINSIDREIAVIESKSSKDRPKLPIGLQPFTEEWRGIPAKFLQSFKSSLYFDTLSKVYRILWPVTFNHKLDGWVAGYIPSEDGKPDPPYRNGVRSKSALFGIDTPVVAKSSTIVLVEGPYDCIRLQYEGIPAVSILGTGNWSRHKGLMLKQRTAGPTKKVIIAFDGDKAGDECRVIAFKDLKPLYDNLECFDLPDGQDPGNCSEIFVDELRKLCSK